ncbi:MAG: hypothetical protein Q8K98_03300 [Bacteroidota bacterium]|nr:hypothetical protein [Bacteroidota bacterium]
MNLIIGWLLGGATILGAIILLLFLNPEKFEKWVALLWKLSDKIGVLVKVAHKQYVKHDLQSSVNSYLKRRTKDMPGLEAKGVRVEWVDAKINKQSFLEGNNVIVRLRRQDSNDQNFVRAACLFVSTSLLYKVKRYLSPSQAEATDLFVSMKLIEEEKPQIVDVFLEEYLHKSVTPKDSKIGKYFDKYSVMQKGGYFFPVYLQELHFLGQKMFGNRQDSTIHTEVDSLINYLEKLAQRKIGDTSMPLDFVKEYCRFGLVIVGKPSKLIVSIDPYVNFIKKGIASSNIETLYVLGLADNEEKIKQICEEVLESFDVLCERKFQKVLRYTDHSIERLHYLAVLRSKKKELFISSKKI